MFFNTVTENEIKNKVKVFFTHRLFLQDEMITFTNLYTTKRFSQKGIFTKTLVDRLNINLKDIVLNSDTLNLISVCTDQGKVTY